MNYSMFFFLIMEIFKHIEMYENSIRYFIYFLIVIDIFQTQHTSEKKKSCVLFKGK